MREAPFTVREACRILGVRKSKAYLVLGGLMESGKVVRIARGIYGFSKAGKIVLSPDIDGIRERLLSRMTRRFKFTALSVLERFIHHVPRVLIYHLFVEPGSADDFSDEIREADPELMVLVGPKKSELMLLLDKTAVNKVMVILESSYFYSSNDGMASPESAFVDLYFEVTRDRVPFMRTDLEEMLKLLAHDSMINYSTLLRYAHERGLREEMERFLKGLGAWLDIPEGVLG